MAVSTSSSVEDQLKEKTASVELSAKIVKFLKEMFHLKYRDIAADIDKSPSFVSRVASEECPLTLQDLLNIQQKRSIPVFVLVEMCRKKPLDDEDKKKVQEYAQGLIHASRMIDLYIETL